MSLPHDDFSSVRPMRRWNRLTQAALAIGLAVMINFLASKSSFRFREDLTRDHRHSLAAESVQTIQSAGLKGPIGAKQNKRWVRALILNDNFAEGDVGLRNQLGKLLEAYKLESSRMGAEWFGISQISNGLNQEILSEVAAQHGPPARTTVLILTCENRVKYVNAAELVATSEDQRVVFRGEEVVTSALLEVTEDQAAVCYITRGHGELGLEDTSALRGMSQFSRLMRSRNFVLRSLDLTTAAEIPHDASMILVAGPQTAFSTAEMELLRTYLFERNGRVLMLLDPGRSHGLEIILSDWAIFSPEAELQEPDPTYRTPDGDIALRRLTDKPHPLTRVLREQDLPIIAARLRPSRFDEGSTPDSTLSVTPLIFTSDKSWGEADPEKQPIKYDPNRDQPGPVCIATAAERAAGIRKGGNSSGGRLVVIGSSEIAANARINRGGNQAFLVQCAAWLSDRDRAVSLPSRATGVYQVNATASDFWTLAWRFCFIPLTVLALGLAISIWRRRS
ncbi:MAG: DUF4350 domain-containing protein [bacterium]